jgi:hypothetical protein
MQLSHVVYNVDLRQRVRLSVVQWEVLQAL